MAASDEPVAVAESALEVMGVCASVVSVEWTAGWASGDATLSGLAVLEESAPGASLVPVSVADVSALAGTSVGVASVSVGPVCAGTAGSDVAWETWAGEGSTAAGVVFAALTGSTSPGRTSLVG